MWPWYEPTLKRATDENPEADITELKGKLLTGFAQLFQWADGLMVTQVDASPAGKTLTIAQLAGHGMNTWADTMEQHLCAIAKCFGCVRVKVIGRKGWERMGRKYGYQLQTLELVKNVY